MSTNLPRRVWDGNMEVVIRVFRGKDTKPTARKLIVSPDEIRPTPEI